MTFLVNSTFQLPPRDRNIINYFQCHCRTYFTLHSFTIPCSRLIQVSIVSSYSLILYTRQQELDECSLKQPFVTCSKWLTSAIVSDLQHLDAFLTCFYIDERSFSTMEFIDVSNGVPTGVIRNDDYNQKISPLNCKTTIPMIHRFRRSDENNDWTLRSGINWMYYCNLERITLRSYNQVFESFPFSMSYHYCSSDPMFTYIMNCVCVPIQ
jgi:hypothetical protein